MLESKWKNNFTMNWDVLMMLANKVMMAICCRHSKGLETSKKSIYKAARVT